MVPLLLLGVLALAIILERFWSLRRTEVMPPPRPGSAQLGRTRQA